ncbi:Trp biosynthesis-associated membrane protein [Amycolatopsis sp. QT-25]|uniref:Trp biosynthesis-associated membrane protein n=1 Tax=Amycolatopsis sp. QT-25 TaxID=3034022 RepID=UPI0023ED6E72|nr:Trp biosynthesis-associated membrane protein [Amycolatopsis sp. QT-25]WET77513.1 Trp biosynthesis-associated membrane protein [Amycolatopsis sp. QT-25]
MSETPEDAAPPPKQAKRPLWIAVVGLLLGAVALWGSSQLVWFAEFRDGGVRGTVLYTEIGAQRAVALVPLALLALAGTAGLIATGGWPRRVLGVVLAVSGVAAVWLGVVGGSLSGFADGLPVAQLLGARGLAILGGILVVAGGLAAIKGAGRMPRLGAKYSAPGTKKRAAKDPETELWEALSEGEDPTATR